MSFISKLKGAKKAADTHKAKLETQDKPAAAPYKHVPTHAATDAMIASPGGWKSEEIAYQNKARLSRIGSDYSTRPSTSYSTTTTRSSSRPGFNRANSDSSLDFTPSMHGFSAPMRSSGSSMKSAAVSRNTSFQGLEKVMEANDRDQEPVFAAALLANRTKASRSPRGSTRSSLGKSPLSSVGGQIELRSPAVAYAPTLEIRPDHRASQVPVENAQPQRKYFGHNKGSISETKDIPAPAPVVVKKERFSFMKRNSSVAAH
ncbi:hypothetical protein E4T52_13021 [Aureobasidium sp. EXF-3400]|nr:hypothetical protein E4T51_00096 [Aureobasidium sp. EXF-12344]KAI4771986.1 hypothetical protein E4T52_13021 [Aureobasidium sp. EXF-3400]